MTVCTPDSGFEALERRYESMARVVQYVLLAAPLLPYVLVFRPDVGAFAVTVGVAAAAGAWITWGAVLHPCWTQRPWQARLYVVGLIAFIGALTLRSAFFAFFTWLGFLHAFRFLNGAWRWVAAAAVALCFAVGQAGGFHRPTPSTVAIWALLACVDLMLVGVSPCSASRARSRTRPASR